MHWQEQATPGGCSEARRACACAPAMPPSKDSSSIQGWLAPGAARTGREAAVHDVQAVQEAQRLRDVRGDVQRVAQPALPRLAAWRLQKALRLDGILRARAHIPDVRDGVGL